MDEIPWAGAYEGDHLHICNDLLFTIETDQAGLKMLIAGDGLELCARFNLTNSRFPEECVCNLPVKSMQPDH